MTAIRPDSARKLRQRENRQHLLAVARAIFTSHGYEAATMRLIATMAGMSTGALFSNWPDKAAIYREVYGHDPLTPEQGRQLVEVLAGRALRPAWLNAIAAAEAEAA